MMRTRFLILGLATLWALDTLPLPAQDNTLATLLAERQELDEKYKSLAAAVRALQENQEVLQKKLEAALAELRALQEKTSRTPTNWASNEDIRRLAERLVELDKSRVADNKLVLDKIAELAKTLKAPPPAPAHPLAPTPRKTALAKEEKGYEYVVQSGDTLTRILKEYRDAGIKVSQKAIEEANPGVDWNRLKIGQKIWIPAPAE
ncbi:LysM domain-containing protein [Fontisphaera persica]|uniref:LysM peptidoglycan-binding domain-containing protein n=1 Tax=Fontisphaera persica TaxID=2974023 RepID=UPI0024BF3DB7|nr:LysM domain-containing protein [Fontisphaera persica]WCJ59369.1 LysM domain-containing protein [Fontisphaera persica]